jgi:glycosyltransferase involved in cell wall biosynthesis
MASGTPVVASHIPGIDEQIVPDETGLLHPVGDVARLAQSLIQILENKDLAVRLAAAAQNVVKQNYHWAVIGRRTEQVFEPLITAESHAL